MNARALSALVMVAALALAPVGAPDRGAAAAQQALPTLTLFLGFIPNIQFAPVYMALERGYFAEAGVDVVLEYGDENVGAERLAVNDLQFGIISGEQVILARAGGRPLVYVFEWWQRFPVAIVAPVSSGITSPADLAGRTVGVPGRFGASWSGLRALLAASGLAETDLQIEEIGFNAPAMICADRVEAAVVYVANEPVQIADQCTDVTIIEISPLADLVANGLVTNEQTIADDPDLVRGMVSALSRGLADTLADPDAALEASRPYVETLPQGGSRLEVSIAALDVQRALAQAVEDGLAITPEQAGQMLGSLTAVLDPAEVIQMKVLRNSMALWDAPRLGLTDPESWQVTLDVLVDIGFIQEPFGLAGAYTNDFLP